MKNILVSIMLLGMMPASVKTRNQQKEQTPVSENIFIITTDGFRWQEFYNGADSSLINNESITPASDLMKTMFWSDDAAERRKRLMPFVWNVIAAKRQLYGNRKYGSKVNVTNGYAISYPGYNEILTGNADPFIASNKKYNNPNINILEYLDSKKDFEGKVVAFTSWNVFPYILNTKRNNLPVNSGYTNANHLMQTDVLMEVENTMENKAATRNDQLTFIAAKEYIRKNQPRVVYLGFGETDESAHAGRYDLYLQQAHAVDRMIAELWQFVQTTEGYKDNTTFIITTDHGRGEKPGRWTSHGSFIKGSSQVWLAVLGPQIKPIGEVKAQAQFYQSQLAQTIANLLGEEFEADQPVAASLQIPAIKKLRRE